MNGTAKYPIKYISNETGISQLLIRTWENRYDLLKPVRTKTNRRLYSDEDFQRLKLIKKSIDKGLKIGDLHLLSVEELKKLNSSSEIFEENHKENNDFISKSISYIKNFDSINFTNLLQERIINSSKKVFINEFIFPLLYQIGKQWESGEIRISHEHFATAIIRDLISSLIEEPQNIDAPVVLVCAPRNQNHDLGALSLAVLTSIRGYRIIYLGSSVPAEDIISTSRKTNAKAVILSIVFPKNDFSLISELKKLDQYLGNTDVFIGGSAAESYYKFVQNTGIRFFKDPDSFLEAFGNLDT